MNTYNTKFILNYCNKGKDRLTIELQEKDYIGEAFIIINEDDYLLDNEGKLVVTNIDGEYAPARDINRIDGGSRPFVLEYLNNEDDKGGSIRATSAIMEFYESDLFNIEDLATSDEMKLKCIFKFNDAVEWIGFVVPDFYHQEITQNPVITLTASDRIGILKDVPYPINQTKENILTSYISIITDVLKHTGLNLGIHTICDFECEEWAETGIKSTFLSTYVNEQRFIKGNDDVMNCYDVLKAVLNQFNCLLVQYRGEWWIVNKDQLESGEGIDYIFDHNGTFIEQTTFKALETTFSLIDTGGQKTIMPANGVNMLKVDYGQPKRYPSNNEFQKVRVGGFAHWSNFGMSEVYPTTEKPLIYNLNGTYSDFMQMPEQGLKVDFMPMVHFIVNNDGSEMYLADTSTKYIESDSIKLPDINSDQLDIDISIDLTGKGGTFHFYMIYFHTWSDDNETHTYHLLKRYNDYHNGTTEGEFIKLNDNLKPSNESYYRGIVTFQVPGGQGWVKSAYSGIDNIKAKIPTAVITNVQNSRLYVRYYGFYEPDLDARGNLNAVLWGIDVKFTTPLEQPKGTIYKSEIQGNYTKHYTNEDYLFSDYETSGKNGFFYKYRNDYLSIQYNENGEQTKNWTFINNTNVDTQLLHTLRQITKRHGKAYQELQIGFDQNRIHVLDKFSIKCFSERYITVENKYLTSENGTYITTEVGKYLDNKKFVFVKGEIDYLRSHLTGTFAEVVNKETDSKEYIYSYFND